MNIPTGSRLGTKRQCLSCGAKFYDFHRQPPTCPKCKKPLNLQLAAPAEPDAAPAPTPVKRTRTVSGDWTLEQTNALGAVGRWMKGGQSQVFRLFGYAGVGKTTLARHIAETADGETAFAAFTGKAAMVMRSKGCTGAVTIHSLIYRANEVEEGGAPTFTLNQDGPASKAGLIVIDECSMVDEELGRDLASFGKPILVLGDPAQLPPVKGGGYFTDRDPDVMLTEIHRQAKGDPILQLAHRAREGLAIEAGRYGQSSVIARGDVTAEMVMGADQVLVGTNKTRRAYNGRMRQLKGFDGVLPVAGDRLVCLRNERRKGLTNGGLWTVAALAPMRKDFVRMTLAPEDGAGAKSVKVAVHKAFFEGLEGDLPFPVRRESDEFDYGYALTVHKAQGSQWDDVLLFDESYAFREHRSRWLYTAITRAAKKLTLVR